MLLDSFKDALAYLGVDSEDELQERFDKEKARTEEETENLKKPRYDLDTVLKKAQWAKKSEESEADQKTTEPISEERLLELEPQKDFSVSYQRAYIRAVLWAALYDNENIKNSIVTKILSGEIGISDAVKNILHELWDTIRFIVDNSQNCLTKELVNYRKYLYWVRKQIRDEMSIFTEQEENSENDFALLKFCRDSMFLLLSIGGYTYENACEDNQVEAISYLFFYIGYHFYDKDDHAYNNAVQYLQNGLLLTEPEDQRYAFWALGYSAWGTPACKQLAYDTFYSWIHAEPVGEICKLLPKEYQFSEAMKQWKQADENADEVSLIYEGMAVVCNIICSSYRPQSKMWKRFNGFAVQYSAEASRWERKRSGGLSALCLEMRAAFLLKQGDLDSVKQAIMFFQKAYEVAKNEDDKQFAACLSNSIVEAELERTVLVLLEQNTNQPANGVIAAIKKYQLNDEQLVQNGLSEEFSADLIFVDVLAFSLCGYLRRKEYNTRHYYTRDQEIDKEIGEHRENVQTIAYYTSIRNAAHLFDVLHRENTQTAPELVTDKNPKEYQSGLNCLTMMNAHYMNDPTEGLALANAVSAGEPVENKLFYGSGEQFREEIYNDSFVFLKSFTDNADKLLMWNRYGSDRNLDVKDSNGCYVEISADFFQKVNEFGAKTTNLLLDQDDDYALYRVLYLTRSGEINWKFTSDAQDNPEIEKIEVLYKLLIDRLKKINREMQHMQPEQIELARDHVRKSLRKLIFLFKYDDYADESEYRLIETRPLTQTEGIRVLPGDPNLLCINPYFQVAIKRIILGPNVKDADRWIPYFQYEISKMWQRAKRVTDWADRPQFTVEKSKIPYQP